MKLVKRSIDQKLRLRNSDARNEKTETGAVVTSRRGLSCIERGNGICYQWKAEGQCSRGDQGSFRHETHDRAKPTPKAARSSEPPTPRGRSASRKRSLLEKPVWEVQPTTVRKLLEKYLH